MSRRIDNDSPLEDVIAIMSILPWWINIILAIASYFLLHSMSLTPTVAPPAERLGLVFVSGMKDFFITVGQYLAPFAFLLAAFTSAMRNRKKY